MTKKKKPKKPKMRKPRAKPVRVHKSKKDELLERIVKLEIEVLELTQHTYGQDEY